MIIISTKTASKKQLKIADTEKNLATFLVKSVSWYESCWTYLGHLYCEIRKILNARQSNYKYFLNVLRMLLWKQLFILSRLFNYCKSYTEKKFCKICIVLRSLNQNYTSVYMIKNKKHTETSTYIINRWHVV